MLCSSLITLLIIQLTYHICSFGVLDILQLLGKLQRVKSFLLPHFLGQVLKCQLKEYGDVSYNLKYDQIYVRFIDQTIKLRQLFQ